jgi:hypothetical protein
MNTAIFSPLSPLPMLRLAQDFVNPLVATFALLDEEKISNGEDVTLTNA